MPSRKVPDKARLHLNNKYAGSALQFTSRSWLVTLVTYLLPAALAYRAGPG